MTQSPTTLPLLLKGHQKTILSDWAKEQLNAVEQLGGSLNEEVLLQQSEQFLQLFQIGLESSLSLDMEGSAWKAVKELLAEISCYRAQQGFSPSETATFIFSLKQPLFNQLKQECKEDLTSLVDNIWLVTTLLDKLGLYSTEVQQKTRDNLIKRQQEEMLELSTPAVKLWDGILALPLIGTLDSYRTQSVMENLLQKIVETSCQVAIVDITGVPNVDTLVAQHLLKTVTAARLMGAECIISGIRPQIAQAIVHLGIELGGIITKASLADAFKQALQITGGYLGNQKNVN